MCCTVDVRGAFSYVTSATGSGYDSNGRTTSRVCPDFRVTLFGVSLILGETEKIQSSIYVLIPFTASAY